MELWAKWPWWFSLKEQAPRFSCPWCDCSRAVCSAATGGAPFPGHKIHPPAFRVAEGQSCQLTFAGEEAVFYGCRARLPKLWETGSRCRLSLKTRRKVLLETRVTAGVSCCAALGSDVEDELCCYPRNLGRADSPSDSFCLQRRGERTEIVSVGRSCYCVLGYKREKWQRTDLN